MGVVLHASIPYFSGDEGWSFFWPADPSQSALLFGVFDFIHVWRMPVFFLLAGFFAHLVFARRMTSRFTVGRLKRIALPLLIFAPIMAILVPAVWIYGYTNELPNPLTLGFGEDLLTHLWFLYYLLVLYAILLLGRAVGQLIKFRSEVGNVIGKSLFSRVPVLIVVLVAVLLIFRDGNETKSLWPINWPDMLYNLLFFLYGYGLYARRNLLNRLSSRRVFLPLLGVGAAAFALHLVFIEVDEDLGGLTNLVGYSVSAVAFTLGFVGLFMRLLTRNSLRVRWLADSSYWIYIMHLPVVAFLNFYMFRFGWPAEVKLLLVCAITALIGIVTYRYLVRYTPLGWLLNGQRSKSPSDPPLSADPQVDRSGAIKSGT